MKQLPAVARVYVSLVIAAGVMVFAACLPRVELKQPAVFGALLVLAAATATLKVYLPLKRSGSTMSVSSAVDFAALLLLGPHETIIVAVVSVFCQCNLNTRDRTPPHRTLFSMASMVLTIEGAGVMFRLLGGEMGPGATWLLLATPLAGTALVYFLLNTGLVATAVALSSGERIHKVWYNNFLWSAPGYFVSFCVAALAASLIRQSGVLLVPLTSVPLYLTYRSYKLYMGRVENEQRQVKQTAELHLATIEALARAIDAKDQSAYTRLWRVQLYAARLAQAIGLGETDVRGIKTAALLQDIGKLAVPEHILSKPGPLTKEEFEKIRSHPEVGAEIIATVPFPYPVAPTISSHHEHWDGGGYPLGLRGEAIPLGSRILTVVDYFDAVTTERPYRKAFGVEEAIDLLKREAGAALDPHLVKTFIELLPSLLVESAEHEESAPSAIGTGTVRSGEPTEGPATDAPQSAFENIALAHREIYALYEIAQPMSTSLSAADTMALISSKLAKIVPWSGCSLFLRDPKAQTLTCAFAVGLDVPRLLNRTLSGEYSLDRWVANTRRPLVNSDPRLTFESAGLDGRTELKSALLCPLVFNDALLGVLAVYHVDADRYTEGHQRLLERVAEQAGVVLHNSLVFEKTQEEALTDALTGLSNRRSIVLHLSQELSRAERLRSRVALILLDIDDFKSINDTYGHNIGDRALCEVAAALQSVLRSYDLCARYGGDEFVLVLPNCTREAAEARRIELQQRINRVQLDVRPEMLVTLGASAGVSVFPDDGATYEVLIAEADRRMYRDKAGRKKAGSPGSGRHVAQPSHSGANASSTLPADAPLPTA